jgi:AcrR family transcriptional regulator
MSTRDRIVEAAMELFASKGFHGTTTGDIESAAGLAPRRGGMYRHFPSKRALFEACLDRWITEVRAFPAATEVLPLDDLRSELTVIARGSLRLLERQHALFAFLARDAGAFPDLVARVHAELVTVGYRQLTAWFRSRLSGTGTTSKQIQALAAVALAALIHYRQDTVTYGAPPGGVPERDFIEAWVTTWDTVMGGLTAPRSSPTQSSPRTRRAAR